MINSKMGERLNKQLNTELGAWYLYMSIAAYCRSLSMNGFATWFDRQSTEEQGHAMKIYQYLIEQDSPVTLLAIAEPERKFKSLTEVFEKTLAHEKHVTKLVNELMNFAVDEKDNATIIFLQWFVTEQIEEEATVRDILEQLKLVRDSGEGLLLLDRELASKGVIS